ncbi:glycoside hydrolase family 3 C-terminal domain-containing protein [uncultured Draconibacterium sp.]|uniref:glycoside hydrolase family 3 C-terminal domain-containing protein n=1 Tax=uncultured Draconibacterium sp. TaxID=1573823 RepID=UPI003216A03C
MNKLLKKSKSYLTYCLYKNVGKGLKKAFILVLAINSFSCNIKESVPQLGENSIKEVIDALTLKEKAKMVASNAISEPDYQGLPLALGHYMFGIPKLGIPNVALNDGPAGLHIDSIRPDEPNKKYFATAWPASRLIASSWDMELAEKVAAAYGHELKEYGIGIVLGPGLNIHRNPLCGRNFEYYSEDPLVSGLIASAMVDGVQSNGVGTCLKHFVANNQETQRNVLETYISERALREIYLRTFEIPVRKSQPWTIMTALNYLNGPYVSENPELLTTILRDEWGFKGFVMTDWFGGIDPIKQLKAGNDLLTPGIPTQVEAIIKAVENKELPVEVLDKNIERILSVIEKTAIFKGYQFSDDPDLKANAQFCRTAATEGMILLKNNQVLPFNKDIKKIALFGNEGYRQFAGGLGSGQVNRAYENPISQGLENAGYTLDANLKDAYLSYIANYDKANPKGNHIKELFEPTPPAPIMQVKASQIEKMSSEYDIAVLVLGRISGENLDRAQQNFEITGAEKQIIKDVSKAFHSKGKKVVVVLNIAGVIETASWRDDVDAIFLAWMPGQEGGNAIADVLTGKVNPSGKLTTTFPMKYSDVPSAKNFPGNFYPEKSTRDFMGYKYIPGDVTYEEGIYVGYRYYNSFNVKPAYEFGYGLSYTDFKYSNLELSAKQFTDEMTVKVTITNTGKTAGKEAVQIYLSAPTKSMDKPTEELKAFAKTGLLEPGASQTLTFKLNARDLSSFSTEQSAWFAEAGKYTVKAGASSRDFRLIKSFELANDMVVEKVHKALVPTKDINDLKSRR